MKLLADRRFRLAAIIALSMAAGSAMTSAAIAAQTHMLNARALLERAMPNCKWPKPTKGATACKPSATSNKQSPR
jgi:hypothetical protein